MKYIITGLLFLWVGHAFSQIPNPVSLRIQNNYFITGQPVFGLGVDLSKSSSTSLLFMAEYGKYASTQKNLLSANIETYSLTGFSLGSEFRLYQPFSPAPMNTGGFIGVFSSFKRLIETNTEGVKVVSGGIELSDPQSFKEIIYTNTSGLCAGWRLGNPEKKIMLEGSVGFGYQSLIWKDRSSFLNASEIALSKGWVSRIEMAFLIKL